MFFLFLIGYDLEFLLFVWITVYAPVFPYFGLHLDPYFPHPFLDMPMSSKRPF